MFAALYFKRTIIVFMLITALCWPCQSLALTIGEERLIGQKILYSVRRDLHILDDPDISQYINRLGSQVLKVVGPQYFDYRFYVVQSEQFNAFAAPAGMVFFYSGLIEAMHKEDELVSVLAHEIGHVASRHLAQRLDHARAAGHTADAHAGVVVHQPHRPVAREKLRLLLAICGPVHLAVQLHHHQGRTVRALAKLDHHSRFHAVSSATNWTCSGW